MTLQSTRVPYRQTNAFNRIILDYVDQADALRPFYRHPVSLQGIQQAIAARSKFPTNRTVLVDELKKQYTDLPTSEKVKANIDKLKDPSCFTVTTAHQNNLFTGPLYFIYKIIHTIRLAAHLNETISGKTFVPVFYIGSEDADLEELNHIWLNGEKLVWDTKQTGAVGRMKTDKDLHRIIDRMEGELSVYPFGKEITGMLRKHYSVGTTIARATFHFLNELFADQGLVILDPDNAALKSSMKPVFFDDLQHQTASVLVEATTQKLEAAGYKIQAYPREINLFYLEADKRKRIERPGQYPLSEFESHPERLSPNVILRGLYQETILPNIAFVGGGGETAYWLQLKELFDHYQVPFPVLVLRNSFMILEKKWGEMTGKLGFTAEDLFHEEQDLMNAIAKRESRSPLSLQDAIRAAEQQYADIRRQALAVDPTLAPHVEALAQRALHKLRELEKKMLRAERRKYADQQRQLHTVREHLFPGKGLQERKDNFCAYYAKWGRDLFQSVYDASPSLEQEFVILSER